MTEFKTKRDPRIPSIPNKTDWQQFERIEQWRRSNLTIIRQLHADVNDDLNTLANETAELEANQHAPVTVANSNTATLTLSGQQITAYANQQGTDIIFPWELGGASNGTWDFSLSANQMFQGYFVNTSNANGNYLSGANFFLGGGSSYLKTLYVAGPDSGIVQILYNGVVRATIDMYNAGSYLYNQIASNTLVGVSTPANLQILVNGKNASSSGYFCRITYMGIRRYV